MRAQSHPQLRCDDADGGRLLPIDLLQLGKLQRHIILVPLLQVRGPAPLSPRLHTAGRWEQALYRQTAVAPEHQRLQRVEPTNLLGVGDGVVAEIQVRHAAEVCRLPHVERIAVSSARKMQWRCSVWAAEGAGTHVYMHTLELVVREVHAPGSDSPNKRIAIQLPNAAATEPGNGGSSGRL